MIFVTISVCILKDPKLRTVPEGIFFRRELPIHYIARKDHTVVMYPHIQLPPLDPLLDSRLYKLS